MKSKQSGIATIEWLILATIVLIIGAIVFANTLGSNSPATTPQEKPKPYIIEVSAPDRIMVRSPGGNYIPDHCLSSVEKLNAEREIALKYHIVREDGDVTTPEYPGSCTESVSYIVEPLSER